MKKIFIQEDTKKADTLSKSRDGVFIDKKNKLNNGGKKHGKNIGYSNKKRTRKDQQGNR